MPDGLLWVLSQPPAGGEARFHAWYDDEHAPARAGLPGVHTADRLQAADGEMPGWLAAYDIDLGVLATPAYVALRDERSDRERAVMAELETLDRRVYELLRDHGDATAAAPLWVAVALTVEPGAETELDAWYDEEHVPLLHAIPGWRRTRLLRLCEGDAPARLALHELDDETPFATDAYRHATSTERRSHVMTRVVARERRVFRRHKRFL